MTWSEVEPQHNGVNGRVLSRHWRRWMPGSRWRRETSQRNLFDLRLPAARWTGVGSAHFYVVSTALMLVWNVWYVVAGRHQSHTRIMPSNPHARLIGSANAAISDFTGGQSARRLGRHRSALGRIGSLANH